MAHGQQRVANVTIHRLLANVESSILHAPLSLWLQQKLPSCTYFSVRGIKQSLTPWHLALSSAQLLPPSTPTAATTTTSSSSTTSIAASLVVASTSVSTTLLSLLLVLDQIYYLVWNAEVLDLFVG